MEKGSVLARVKNPSFLMVKGTKIKEQHRPVIILGETETTCMVRWSDGNTNPFEILRSYLIPFTARFEGLA